MVGTLVLVTFPSNPNSVQVTTLQLPIKMSLHTVEFISIVLSISLLWAREGYPELNSDKQKMRQMEKFVLKCENVIADWETRQAKCEVPQTPSEYGSSRSERAEELPIIIEVLREEYEVLMDSVQNPH